MGMSIPGHVVHLGLGALLVVASIPLILRIVPMNRVYGVMVPQSYKSERNWYAINAYGGWLLLLYGAALVAFSYIGRGLAPPPTSPWTAVYVAGPMLLFLPLVGRINAYARRL